VVFQVILLISVEVHGECIIEDDLPSLIFKKQDKLQDEVARMREKMQDEMTVVREELAGMRVKLHSQEEINKLNIERLEERSAGHDNKPPETVECHSKNESSLALAVLQLSTTLENLQTGRVNDDINDLDHVKEQVPGLIASRSSSSDTNMSRVDTAIELLTGLQEKIDELAVDRQQNQSASANSQFLDIVKGLQEKVDKLTANIQQLQQRGGDSDSSQGLNNNHGNNTNKRQPRYCHDIYIQGERRDGVYEIYPGWNVSLSVSVWCEFDVGAEVGWTVILARMPTETPINFSRGWNDYKAGFGDAHNEYWIGLSLLHDIMLSHCSQVLHVTLHSWDHTSRHAQYKEFTIGDEETGFKLTIGGYSGDAGDALTYSNGRKFTTRDKDNDGSGSSNCAMLTYERGGFWYNNCAITYPCSVLRKKGDSFGIRWDNWVNGVNLKKIIFKISPRLPSLI
ncbi:unnamed protein product, partial [Meganyctiphanes norvegica]